MEYIGLTESTAVVELPGGYLHINWPNIDDNIYMTGPAKYVYSGIGARLSRSLAGLAGYVLSNCRNSN